MHLFAKALLITVLFVTLGNVAVASDPFTIEGIKVSSIGTTGKQAKDTAMLSGEREAFSRLLEKINANQPGKEAININADKLSELVQGVEVNDEKITETYYSATLNISFNKQLVEAVLKPSKAVYADKKATPILIVPFLVVDGQPMLFEEQNPLRNALANIAKASPNLTLIVPANLRSIDKYKLNSNIESLPQDVRDSLLKLGQNYKAGKVILVLANKIGERNLNIRLQDINEKTSAIKEISIRNQDVGQEDVFNYAAKGIIAALQVQGNSLNNEHDTELSLFTVTVPISSLEEWSFIQKKLQQLSFLNGVLIRSMSVEDIIVDLNSHINFADLSNKMLENGFSLERNGDKIILLTKENKDPLAVKNGAGSLEGPKDGI